MMRSPRYFAVAVRAPNGEIVLQTEALEKSWIGRQKWLKWPFFRGSLALLDAMALGIRAMQFASNIQLDDRYQPDAPASASDDGTDNRTEEGSKVVQPILTGGDTLKKGAVGASMATGIAVGIFVFVVLPNLVAELFRKVGIQNTAELNLITGIIKIVFFLGYIYAIGKIEAIHRVFCYHGAEHKAINTLEAEMDLTLDNCKKQTRLHPRCGTSFAIIVILIDLLLMVFVPRVFPGVPGKTLNLILRIVINIGLLPIFAGIAYELIRFAGKFRSQKIVMAMFAPGLATQYLTTAEPEPDQIEVALTALRACVDAEQTHGLAEKVDAPPVEETTESIA